MFWINQTHVWIAGAATLFLMLAHSLNPWFRFHILSKDKAFISFAGGVSVAYVFLDMLPNLVEYNKPIGKFLINNQWLTPFTELLIYIVSLIGFLIYYAIDVFAERYEIKTEDNRIVYGLHLIMFCFYNLLITYTMSLRALSGITVTALFTFAMALHFTLTDRKFYRLYPIKFNALGRFFLIISLLIGWLLSMLFDPINVLFVAFMIAFLAGSILLNVFREELPSRDTTSFSWFTIGVTLITVILLSLTFLTLRSSK